MNQIVIIYEFQNSLINNRQLLENKIRQYGQFAFISKNSCIIFTYEDVIMVRNNLIGELAIGDKLFVALISAPAAWSNSLDKQVSDYIIINLQKKFF